MTSTQVQRTLVKSAPEIWAELSDPAALARHLDPVGEIRITRAEPEQKVEWEADGACGAVLIKSSGWGTRVTLTMSREEGESGSGAAPEAAGPPRPEALSKPAAASEPEGKPEPEAASGTEGSAHEQAAVSDSADEAAGQDSPTAPAASELDQEPEPELAGAPPAHRREPEPELAGAAPAHRRELVPRRGLLARLLRRRGRPARPASSASADSLHGLAVRSPGVGPWPTASTEWVNRFPRREPDSESAPAVAEPELEEMLGEQEVPAEAQPPSADEPAVGSGKPPVGADAVGRPDSGAPDTVEAAADSPGEDDSGSGERQAGAAEQEAGAAEHDAAVLSAVLDRLGAAHHRPFSRA